MKWCDIEMMKWIQNGKMAKCWYCDSVIWCDSILLGQICNTKSFIYFYKNLVNIRVSEIPYIHDMKTQLESLTKEVMQLCRANKEQYKTPNRANNFLEQLCYGNGQQQLYTASTTTLKRKKIDVDITSEYNCWISSLSGW